MDIEKNFREVLKEIRKEKGFSQEKLAYANSFLNTLTLCYSYG